MYHVTVPHQAPVTVYNEAILKMSSKSHVALVHPSSSETLLSIKYGDIRRMGYTDNYNNDIIWFETCKNSQADRFFFFVVPSGNEVARQIVQDLKDTIQHHTASLLILEDSTGIEVSYIAREHYGCSEYSAESRSHILHTGLYRLPSTTSRRFFVPCDRAVTRRDSAPLTRRDSANSAQPESTNGGGGVSLEEFGRRKSKSVKLPPPASITRRPTLDKFVRQTSFDRKTSSSSERQASVSSFERGALRTPSLDREMVSPSLHELSEGHYSSGSGSDVFDCPAVAHIQRTLSVRSSVSSSQGSSNSSISHSPAAILEEEGTAADSFSFDAIDGSPDHGYSYSTQPTVPPRSIVSLQQDSSYCPGKLAAAH